MSYISEYSDDYLKWKKVKKRLSHKWISSELIVDEMTDDLVSVRHGLSYEGRTYFITLNVYEFFDNSIPNYVSHVISLMNDEIIIQNKR